MNAEWPTGPSEPLIQKIEKAKLNGNAFPENATERPAITDDEREKIEAGVSALAEIMEHSHVWWQLDGSLNISLRNKKQGLDYIGMHSDIDFSVLRHELPQFEEHLRKNGYGLFLRSREGSARSFRRVGNSVFTNRLLDSTRETPYIAAINEQGEIRTDTGLTRAQVSVVDTDEHGDPNERGISYPREWLEGEQTTVNGVPIMLSHPARYLLFKIWFTRPYDYQDIKLFAELHAISKKDLETVEHIVRSTAARDAWWEANGNFTRNPEVLEQRLAYLHQIIDSAL